MSVNWQDSDSPARKYAIAAAEASGKFDEKVPTWDIYCDLRYALIWGLIITGFPPRSRWAITEKNWPQLYRRLYILEHVNGCSRVYGNGNKPPREMYFTPEEIRSMVGLSVNAGEKSEAEFKKYIYNQLAESAWGILNRCVTPTKSDADNPYWQEKLCTPKSVKEMSK